ncbi:hypothetical protein NO263_03815, partial [Gluconacetobacter entanii]|nr:hypothetical protein [Gluconacetobacter entanii]
MSAERGAATSFSQLVAQVEDGQFNHDAGNAIQDLVAAMSDAAMSKNGRSKGKIAITIGFELEGGVITTTTDFKVTKPRMARAKSVFWATPENHLTRRNPRQQEMELNCPGFCGDGTTREVRRIHEHQIEAF